MNSPYLILTALALTRLGFPGNATQETSPCTQAIPNLQEQSTYLSGHHGYGPDAPDLAFDVNRGAPAVDIGSLWMHLLPIQESMARIFSGVQDTKGADAAADSLIQKSREIALISHKLPSLPAEEQDTLFNQYSSMGTNRTSPAYELEGLIKANSYGSSAFKKHCLGTAPPPAGQTCPPQGKSLCTPASARNRNLFEAAIKHTCSAVKASIEEGADVNAKDSNGSTALMWAAWKNELDTAKLLIQNGADVNAKDSKAVTALMYASEKNSHHVAKLLIEKGADINEKNNKGETALMWAAWRDSPAVTTLLLEQGADVNLKDKNGWTALIYATMHSSLDVVKLMIEQGADVNAKNKAGKSALDIANSEEIKKFLREHGAK